MRIILLIGLFLICANIIAQEIPVPSGIKAEFVKTDSTNYIKLIWNEKSPEDSLTVGYNLFVNKELLLYSKAKVIYDNTYYYPIFNDQSALYRLAIAGVSNFPVFKRGGMSEVVEIEIPSQRLPFVKIKEIQENNGVVELNWEYPHEISDLEGFKIYLNNEIVAKTKASDRKWISEKMGEGKAIFQITAYTAHVESSKSQKKLVSIK